MTGDYDDFANHAHATMSYLERMQAADTFLQLAERAHEGETIDFGDTRPSREHRRSQSPTYASPRY